MILDTNYLNEFIDDFPIGIARNDTTGKLPNRFNKFLIEMFGWEVSDIDTMDKWFLKAYPDGQYRNQVLQLWQEKINETEAQGKCYSEPFNVKITCKDGSLKWCEVRYYRKDNFVYGTFVDITETNNLTTSLHKERNKYIALLESAQDGFWMVDSTETILDVNEAYCLMSGYSKDEIIGSKISAFEATQDEEYIKKNLENIIKNGGGLFETSHYKKDGTLIDLEISVSYAKIENGVFFSLLRDITERNLDKKLSDLRLKLSNLVHDNVAKELLLQTALDEAEAITNSKIGFFHFVDDDQEHVSLQVWSTNTLKKMCFAEGADFHYPISEAGVWVDCIHQQKAVIYNDYESLPHKKGLPEGHAPLKGFISVPQFKNEKVVTIVGVGNKESDYTQKDVEIVEKISNIAYEYHQRLLAESKIEFMAYYDVLTGLPNRELLTDRLKQSIALSNRTKQPVAICYLDLDGFKPINDKFGHETGDKLLKLFAQRFKEHLREGDTISRIGGDEFILLLSGFESQKQLKEILVRLIDTANIPFEIDQNRIHISCSIGATIYPIDNSDTDTLIRHADQAMYRAKEIGKSNYIIYTPIENIDSQENEKLLEDFSHALGRSEVVLHYQPKVSLYDSSIIGFEALSRWNHPEKGMLYPASFIHIIENTPQEIALGEWVIKEALAVLNNWHKNGYTYTISVNISPRHIQLQGFADYLEKALSIYSNKFASKLELEILEVAGVTDLTNVVHVMNKCKNLGVKFSLDDFGTGYSSLTHFHRLPIDILKIDQNFVIDMIENSDDLDIVEGVIQLAKALKRPVVAEGVETLEIALMLLYLGSDYAQGYGIAKPMPLDNIQDWISSWKSNKLWKHMMKYKDIEGENSINVALFSHQMWMKEIKEFLTGTLNEIPVSEAICQFSKWYKGAGRTRHGSKESYPFLQAIHHEVHEIADDIHKLMLDNNIENAKKQYKFLKLRSKELKSLVKKMEKQ
ncbi:diguanylate cyclase/phosphodiesterase with PAS/PAC and GAF sensor(s) [Sulfurimonas gotlandica GD1]|uniref:Diguanylate cyclase/phosphodiesterase with PAS/PAC and GAF sensor(S) n=1 Tax=Sulfurimonas gotlandica (strain DSM 19862 / JCM 16533 / GD1) TaxID=929558 RepID=B6BJ28_SULGG|nr:EAL domain-containing protein [Sulfurimonas gotlandica]EDZ63737.1 hypothetical protein CBGD1_1357 [Sulfurimonas gotlandica GD1]EHP30543.1 diguanylate cyclase/phosphodiesterase with PAS/PAC and GAF sensor(s) [Sulfurimonas gotlandica GD1]